MLLVTALKLSHYKFQINVKLGHTFSSSLERAFCSKDVTEKNERRKSAQFIK